MQLGIATLLAKQLQCHEQVMFAHVAGAKHCPSEGYSEPISVDECTQILIFYMGSNIGSLYQSQLNTDSKYYCF